jgi:hypothetical protein
MALLSVRTPEDKSEWPDERLAIMCTAHVVLEDGLYPITEAKRDGKSALLTIDTGEDGPDLPAGTRIAPGTVE